MKCPVCDSKEYEIYSKTKDYELYTTKNIYQYNTCRKCDTIYIDSFPINDLDIIYPKTYYSNKAGNKTNGVLSFLEKVKEFFDRKYFVKIAQMANLKSISALDIGGGTGWMLDILKKANSSVVKTAVVDLDRGAEKIALQNGHIFYRSRVEDFNTDERFNFVLMLNLIEHISSPEIVLRKIKSIMDENGVLLIKTPNTKSLDRKIFKSLYWGGLHCPRHWILFNRESLTMLLEKVGFEIIQFKYTQGAPQWAQSVICSLAKLGFIKLSKEKPVSSHFSLVPFLAFFAFFDFLRLPFFKTSQMFFLVRPGRGAKE